MKTTFPCQIDVTFIKITCFMFSLFNFKFLAYLRLAAPLSKIDDYVRPLYRHVKRFLTTWCTVYDFANLDINQQKIMKESAQKRTKTELENILKPVCSVFYIN